ncbi:NUDIX hydrolase [Alkalicaulis satelles]|uniref:GDP-mannose pyrophosphatase n=1 Tax=Alkalicaulis satelles TaxID=2609175 RepID=A0A5M6ZEZ1_9PROT|nr:NUDIX hydrolase [Alkalicaulis satelles]KAA5801668.1 NUDIX hydrolase [Alkalicaulis satelles]
MSERRRGPWTIVSERLAYENPWVRLRHYEVRQPDGQASVYGVFEPHNLAIGIVPVFADGTIMLVGQHRFALDAWSWELPEGGGPRDVDPLLTARRELKEETGLTARRWAQIADYDVSNSVTTERAIGFIAWELEQGEPEREGSEADMQMRRVGLQQALAMAMSGEIRDGFTLTLLAAADHAARHGRLEPELAAAVLKPSAGEGV